MPKADAHIEQAKHNETFFAEIEAARFSDWAVTVLFYAAVHYVDAYLARKNNEHPGNHDERDRLIRSHPETKPLFSNFQRLKARSRAARYDIVTIGAADVESLRRNDFEPIKKGLSGFLTV